MPIPLLYSATGSVKLNTDPSPSWLVTDSVP